MKRCVVGIYPIEVSEGTVSGRWVPIARFPPMATQVVLSGRQVPNLSRTLRMMKGYGLVALTKNARQIRPTALATEFLVVLD